MTDGKAYAGVSRVIGGTNAPEGAVAQYACACCFERIDRIFGVARGKPDTCDFCHKSVDYQCRLVHRADLLLLEIALAMKERKDNERSSQ